MEGFVFAVPLSPTKELNANRVIIPFFKKGKKCDNPKYQKHLQVVCHVHVHTYSRFRDASTISSGFGKPKLGMPL